MSYTTIKNECPGGQKIYSSELDLKTAVIQFLQEACEGLRFSTEKEQMERETGVYLGKSLRKGQIPYNMQMDIERLSLENAVICFLDSGTAEDAFDVYFCFLEMFVGKYEQTRSMIELLSEFEENTASLLMKHRDHYSHSVYVFTLGLAVYGTSAYYRQVYQKFYGIYNEKEAAHHYLQHWGLASLFHDIGYPFELPFEQMASYFEIDAKSRQQMPMMVYQNMDRFVEINDKTKAALAKFYQKEGVAFQSTNELFAYDIAQKLSKIYGFSKESLEEILKTKPTHPENHNYFMDHAYFSATVLFKKLFEEEENEITGASIDALTAIILHNSLYKFGIASYKDPKNNHPFVPELHPLAFMLMLCDELQCWDRVSYGRNSRMELHPMECRFTFCKGGIQAVYLYDEAEGEKIRKFEAAYQKWERCQPQGKASGEHHQWKKQKPRLKAYSDMVFDNEFQQDIERIVDLSQIPLSVEVKCQPRENRRKKTYLSNSNYIHLYNFAVALNGRWKQSDAWNDAKEDKTEESFLNDGTEKFGKMFRELSLEYKLSCINQAKAFAGYLDKIGCFYTDRPVDYDMLECFTSEDMAKIGPMEHHRWLMERYKMGWRYSGRSLSENQRENERVHPDMIPEEWMEDGQITVEAARKNYQRLDKAEQDKDTEPMNAMLKLLKLFDGLRIYKLNK